MNEVLFRGQCSIVTIKYYISDGFWYMFDPVILHYFYSIFIGKVLKIEGVVTFVITEDPSVAIGGR